MVEWVLHLRGLEQALLEPRPDHLALHLQALAVWLIRSVAVRVAVLAPSLGVTVAGSGA